MKAKALALAVVLVLSLIALSAPKAEAAICGYFCQVDADGNCSCQWFLCNGRLRCGVPLN